MNELCRHLAEICCERLLDEKWLVTPSRRVGYQWLETVSRSGTSCVNVRVKTLKSMALEFASTRIAEESTSLVSDNLGVILVGQAWSHVRQGGHDYLSSLNPTRGLFEMIWQTVNDMRLGGLEPEDVAAERFEVPVKGKEIAAILNDYRDLLKAHKLVDYADILRLAIDELGRNHSALGDEVLVLIPKDLRCAATERQLLDALPGDKRKALPVDGPLTVPKETPEPATDAELLRWLPEPLVAPEPSGDKTAGVFRAVGEVNEIREVLRRCLEEGCWLDEVEVLHTDADTYGSLIYEIAEGLREGAGPLQEGLPVTFAEGIPARYSRPGRALDAWLEWIRGDCLQATLVQMIQDGLLEVPGREDNDFSFSELGGILRSVGIGMGQERYLRKLDDGILGLKRQLSDKSTADEEDEEGAADRKAKAERRLEGMAIVRTLAAGLVEAIPAAAEEPAKVLRASARFLESHARSMNEFDNFARRALLDAIGELTSCPFLGMEDQFFDAWEWLETLPSAVRVQGSGPRPGHLHVAHVLSGGHSGRPHTFIVGLDDGRFPGLGRQDPLVLDRERAELSPHLATSSKRLEDRMELFAEALSRLRGTVTLSHCCYDLLEDREIFPSPVLLSAFRILSGKHDGELGDFQEWVPAASSFAPSGPERCLNENEWCLWRMCGEDIVPNADAFVEERFPHLGRGREAARMREGSLFTEYDGHVPDAGAEHDPAAGTGPALSSSRLEALGRCPLGFFFKYVLGVAPPDELVIDPDQWIDNLAFGSLLHEVFRQFMAELLREGKTPVQERDEEQILRILDDRVRHYRSEFPPPSDRVFRRQYEELKRTVRIFLREEEEHCANSTPVYFEASIGMPSEGEPTAVDTLTPVEIELAQDTVVRARGRVDRIDRLGGPGSNTFAVWDYKTGSTSKYDRPDPLWQGRVVQHALYIELVSQRLRVAVAPDAEVSKFGFFFPGPRGLGARIVRDQADLAEAKRVVNCLCRIISGGCFLATNAAEDDCRYCDYRAICGDPESVARASQLKLNDAQNDKLEAMRELRSDG